MTELRRRMTDDMVVRRMAEATQEAYLSAVVGLARFYRRSPDQITEAEVQAYLLHLIRDRKRAWSTCNIAVHGLRFFYHVTLKQARPTFSIPEYLGRYTHRVALSNHRLLSLDDGVVRFRWKDYADHDRVKVMALDVDEFLRRVLLHVVPRGFMRIRHFGLLANRTRRRALAQCGHLLGHPPTEDTPPESVTGLMLRITGLDLSRCPVCGEGRMQITTIGMGSARPLDTS